MQEYLKCLANRLWGMSAVLFLYYNYFSADILPEFHWTKIISCLILAYFFLFGTSRFENTKYLKII